MKDMNRESIADTEFPQGNNMLKNVGDISQTGTIMHPKDMALTAYEYFERNEECSEICIVDDNNAFIGLLTRTDVLHIFGGRYGYNLHQRNHVVELAKKNTLTVYKDYSIENVSKLAMERQPKDLYEPIVVLEEDKYVGIVTIKSLLTATVSIEVERASEANPLTSLPGNKIIEKTIENLFLTDEIFAMMYLDLDNFKAYNDAYGFTNGDHMIEKLADVMRKICDNSDFLGHVGGDDFVIITKSGKQQELAKNIISTFRESIRELYKKEDWDRGFIISTNRNGEIERFPIASISIAIVTNQVNKYENRTVLNEQIVAAKKQAKNIPGNTIVII